MELSLDQVLHSICMSGTIVRGIASLLSQF